MKAGGILRATIARNGTSSATIARHHRHFDARTMTAIDRFFDYYFYIIIGTISISKLKIGTVEKSAWREGLKQQQSINEFLPFVGAIAMPSSFLR
jgi:hypothetical protein